VRELDYRAKYEAWSIGIYAVNASDWAFLLRRFAIPTCASTR